MFSFAKKNSRHLFPKHFDYLSFSTIGLVEKSIGSERHEMFLNESKC
jgi:hypothetical protein